MTRLVWGEGPPQYDLGLERGVLYFDDVAVPWNGLVSIDEDESAEVDTNYYFDGRRFYISTEAGDLSLKINAFTYPDVFAEYNGYSERKTYRRFGLAYTTIHSGVEMITVIYNAMVQDTNRAWKTIADKEDPSLFSWDVKCSTIPIPGSSPGSRLTMQAPRYAPVYDALIDILYGTDTTDARLPTPAEIVDLYEAGTELRITYNGDGTYNAAGPDDIVTLLANGAFSLTAPTVEITDEAQHVFVASSM